MLVRLAAVFVLIASSSNLAAQPSESIQLIPQDGVHQFSFFDRPTPVWNYNGRIPGPTIRATAGTTLAVEVINRLEEPTTVHWHGLRVDNAMDGVPGVTQDPIQPGGRFTYRLQLIESGTFWYHPHLNAGEQLERGLKGVLIVDPPEKLPWSQDLVWLLDDWRLRRDGTIDSRFNTPHDLMHDGRWGNAATVNGKWKPEVFVRPGERIRLRLINGANARVFLPRFDGLKATVIAVDGRPVSAPFPLAAFVLAPGNRIDLDITIPATAAGRTFKVQDTFTRRAFPIASIQVEGGKAVETPVFEVPTAENYIPASLFEDATVAKTWDLNAIRGGPLGIGWSMNRKLWPDADAGDLPIGKPQKIIFSNSSGRLHPMHIHGSFFRVLERNGHPAVEAFTRDTVLVGPGESIAIGLVPEHTGIWLTHCHIQSHAEAGMMTTLTVE
jgi:FtsP/CotA-like multicopper oxidase with cupredoxin domain